MEDFLTFRTGVGLCYSHSCVFSHLHSSEPRMDDMSSAVSNLRSMFTEESDMKKSATLWSSLSISAFEVSSFLGDRVL